jgi:hypothetical protein
VRSHHVLLIPPHRSSSPPDGASAPPTPGPDPTAHHASGATRRIDLASAIGQATAEYALVLLGAAAVALMLTAWATKSGAIGELFDAVVDQLRDKAR